MITMPQFRVLQPENVSQAVEFLAKHKNLRVLAGGSDLVVNLRNKLFTPEYVLDIKGIKDLQGIKENQDHFSIGTLTTLTEISQNPFIKEIYPVLAKAAGLVAGPNIRNMGTIGGNICLDTRCYWYNQSYFWRKSCNFCLKKDGDICHVAPGGKYCWAAYSGDTAPALLTLDASIKIANPKGEKTLALKDFFVMDGIKKYNLESNEIITEILIPKASAGLQGVYKKFRIRDSVDYPLAGVAIAGKVDKEGNCQKISVALTAVNPAPVLVTEITDLLVGKKLTDDLVEKSVELARKTAKPMKTTLSTMPYRRHMIGVFVKQGLEEILK
ncbi:MAG: FAD binding domain-containing protein [Acidobacteria bacterium]|nr:FAD binding domain-containing protein [Acidobacteriota bacterium]